MKTGKIIITFFISTVIIVLIFNLSPLKSYYYTLIGNNNYSTKKFQDAIKNYEYSFSLNNFSDNKNKLTYNEANSYYKLKEFDKALKNYQKINDQNKDLDFFKYHNIGNTYYRIGEKTSQIIDTIKNWEYSLEYYEKALNLDVNYDKIETQNNYDFVKKKLEELVKQEEEKQKEKEKEEKQKKDKEKSGSGSEEDSLSGSGNTGEQNSNSGKTSESGSGTDQNNKQEKNNDISGRSWTNSGQFNALGSGQNQEENKNLSPEQKQDLQKYLEYLKDFQKENGQYLQRQGPTNESSFDDLLNRVFGGDPLFQEVLPDGKNKGRDW